MKASGRDHPIKLEAERLQVPTDKAVSVGVIVTELVTNAYKYAYPDATAGDVRVTISADGEGSARLVVEDDGVGWSEADAPKGTGLGTRIIKAMAANLRSTIQFEQMKPGTRASIDFQF
jgi:two-component sensor histidine kinase